MKNKLYFFLLFLYLGVVGLILYINGVFTGEVSSRNNLIINLVFLFVIGILFIVSFVSYARLNRCTDMLVLTTEKIHNEYKSEKGDMWKLYANAKDVFGNEILDANFRRYQRKMRKFADKHGQTQICEIEDYLNENLLDTIGMSYYNSAIPGTLTGLGILGTFIGLSIGLGSFSGDDIYTISDNVGPLLSGMKVAFHTSVYGIFFSLVFTFVHRAMMSDAYMKLDEFIVAFKECVEPTPMNSIEHTKSLLLYQANISKYLRTMTELLQGNGEVQVKAVEDMVTSFREQITKNMNADLSMLGNQLVLASKIQGQAVEHLNTMEATNHTLLQGNLTLQKAMNEMLEKQNNLSIHLAQQGEKLATTCDEMSEELSNQLFTLSQSI